MLAPTPIRIPNFMHILPQNHILFHSRTHTHTQTRTYIETQTQIRTHKEMDSHSIRPIILIFVRGIHAQTHTHIYIFIPTFNTAAHLPEYVHVRSGLRIAIRLPALLVAALSVLGSQPSRMSLQWPGGASWGIDCPGCQRKLPQTSWRPCQWTADCGKRVSPRR